MSFNASVQAYAVVLLGRVSKLLALNIELASVQDSLYYSLLKKTRLETDGATYIAVATVCLNFYKLCTYTRVRVGLAHELAHLIPGKGEFRTRWKLWARVLHALHQELLHEVSSS